MYIMHIYIYKLQYQFDAHKTIGPVLHRVGSGDYWIYLSSWGKRCTIPCAFYIGTVIVLRY